MIAENLIELLILVGQLAIGFFQLPGKSLSGALQSPVGLIEHRGAAIEELKCFDKGDQFIILAFGLMAHWIGDFDHHTLKKVMQVGQIAIYT